MTPKQHIQQEDEVDFLKHTSHGVLLLIIFINYIVSSFPFLFGVHSVLWRFGRRHVSEQASFLKSTGQRAKT